MSSRLHWQATSRATNEISRPSFETALAKPLDMPGEWEVALIDLSYPHNWTNLDKPYSLVVIDKPVSITQRRSPVIMMIIS